jgi:hypothetical protein
MVCLQWSSREELSLLVQFILSLHEILTPLLHEVEHFFVFAFGVIFDIAK